MHRRPTLASRTAGRVADYLIFQHPLSLMILAVALVIGSWSLMLATHTLIGEFGSTGWLAWPTQNPFLDWSLSRNGADFGILGHRVGFGAYGSWVPFMSPNGGRYVTLFGHTYGFELWGHVGPFMDTD